MVRPSVRFELDGGSWVGERDSVGFTGETDLGPVEFLITSEALAQQLNPEFESLDRETALFLDAHPALKVELLMADRRVDPARRGCRPCGSPGSARRF